MAASALPVDRLRQYLRNLPSGARALLIAELERAASRGDEIPGGAMLLQEVRALARAGDQQAPRLDNAARLFFRPVEPFLIDGASERTIPGRLRRVVLEPTWSWIVRDLAPAEAQACRAAIDRAAAVGPLDPDATLAHALQDVVAQRMRSALDAANADEKTQRRLAARIGTPAALTDLGHLATVLASRHTLHQLAGRFPDHVSNFSGGALAAVRAVLDTCPRELHPYALVLVLSRLAAPWQLIRLAVKAADSDDATRIAGSSYAIAVSITLGDIERMVEDLELDLKRGAIVAVTARLKALHDAIRGVRTELDLSADSVWARQLAGIRGETSNALKDEIESTPRLVRRLLRPRPAQEIGHQSTVDIEEVADTEARIDFILACRQYAGELAISEMTLRSFQDIQLYLDTSTQTLLDGLRTAGDPDRAFRKSQVDAAIRLCGKAFGREYASLLVKAADIAASPERRVAARG